jgi:serine/threonine protein kinase
MKYELDDIETCPKCQMPLDKKGSGSLTQWIKVCNCGRPETDESIGAPINICASCGKRLAGGRRGTLTQWIFRADLCDCEAPSGVREQAQSAAESAPVETRNGVDELEELPMEPGTFPVERYAPIRCLGTGACGAVFLCIDRLLNKKVAVKVLNYLSREQLVAFQREAKSTSQIIHPNIVKVLDFGVSDGKFPYMVLEYVDGLSLEQILEQRQTLTIQEALPLFNQVCDALIFAHNHGLFHRDLKPTNIVVVGFGLDDIDVRLIDFGLGFTKQQTTTQGKSVAGSPAYMSPDQLLGRQFDERSEIYSFGCVMFEVLTGRPPFVSETALQTISLHAQAAPPSLSEAHGSIIFPEAMESVIATCLTKSPEERYQNVADLRHALLEISDRPDVDRRVEFHLPASESAAGNRLAIVLLVSALICTIGGVIAFQGKWSKTNSDEIVQGTPQKQSYQEPQLGDALDSIESDKWYRSANGKRQMVWASAPNLSDKDIEPLARENDVRRVLVGITDSVTGVGFRKLRNLDIESINIQSTGLTDEGLCEISNIKSLEDLGIALSSELTVEGVRCLPTLPKLRRLHLSVMKIPDGALNEISRIEALDALSLYNSKNLTTADIQHLIKLRKLRFLDLSGTKLHNDVIPLLSKCKSLTNLRLCNLDLTDDNLELLGKLPNLTDLGLSQNPMITARGLKKLSSCKNLETLMLEHCDGISQSAKDEFNKQHPQIRLDARLDPSVQLQNSMESLRGN